MVKSYLQNERH